MPIQFQSFSFDFRSEGAGESPANGQMPQPPVHGEVVYTSSTHKKEYMQFTRWGKGHDIAKFPECSKLFVGGAKDKNKLFTEWMKANKNPDAVEGRLKILASQKREGTCKQELLTVKQMREKGLSEYFCCNSNRLDRSDCFLQLSS